MWEVLWSISWLVLANPFAALVAVILGGTSAAIEKPGRSYGVWWTFGGCMMAALPVFELFGRSLQAQKGWLGTFLSGWVALLPLALFAWYVTRKLMGFYPDQNE